MTTTERPTFGQALLLLGEAFNEPVSEMRIEMYFSALEDMALTSVVAATRLAIQNCRFFPKPVELRELVAGSTADHADAAWGALLAEVRRVGYIGTPRFEDPHILPTITRLWGSWAWLCETLPVDGPELVGWLKQFTSAYSHTAATTQREALAPGWSDLGQAVAAIAARKAIK